MDLDLEVDLDFDLEYDLDLSLERELLLETDRLRVGTEETGTADVTLYDCNAFRSIDFDLELLWDELDLFLAVLLILKELLSKSIRNLRR